MVMITSKQMSPSFGGEVLKNSTPRRSGSRSSQNGAHRKIKTVFLIILMHAIFGAPLFVGTGKADEVSKQELQDKLAYCKTCHGASGQGFRGFNPIPRLAGQPAQYLKNQLKAFTERGRDSNIMYNVSHVLSPAMVDALTKSFSEMNPKPLGGAPRELISTGKKIFEEGNPDASVPPCASCHGPQAKGEGEFPRLAGQLHDYILGKLTNWSHERGQNPAKPDTSAIMEPIAHGLTEAQIRAVAAYVSSLE
jgi:cytochrome c553